MSLLYESRDFGGKIISALLLDALSDLVTDEASDTGVLAAAFRDDLRHLLAVVLRERLVDENHLGVPLAHHALDHLLDDVFGLARRDSLGAGDLPLVRERSSGYGIA